MEEKEKEKNSNFSPRKSKSKDFVLIHEYIFNAYSINQKTQKKYFFSKKVLTEHIRLIYVLFIQTTKGSV